MKSSKFELLPNVWTGFRVGYSVKEVAERLGISTKSMYTWMAKFSKPQRQTDQEAEVRRLK